MNNLETLASSYFASVENLRRIAFESCGVPADTDQTVVDLWLYERLATASHLAGSHFLLMDDQVVVSMIDLSLASAYKAGTFIENCQASLAELAANPVIRHEIFPASHVHSLLLPFCADAESSMFFHRVLHQAHTSEDTSADGSKHHL